VTIDPRHIVYSYDPARQTFLFKNNKNKTWVSVALEGRKVHAAKLVHAWGPFVFTKKQEPKQGEHKIEGDKPISVFFSTQTSTFSPMKLLKLTYRIKFGKEIAPSSKKTKTKPAQVKNVLKTTMDERIRSSSLNRVLKKDSIVFPHTEAGRTLPGPVIVSAGSPPVKYPDVDRIVWTVCPKNEKHLEYLAKRETFLKNGENLKLINWCTKNDLPVAAEFELRSVLHWIWDFKRPEYQKFRKMWIKYADKRQIEYSFTLPVDGEWFVLPDKTGHHRIKKGAAYAFDLVIKKAGKPYRGRGQSLEDHFSWGRPILAQSDGIVIEAEDTNPDAKVGQSGGFDNANYIGVYYGGGISGWYAHIQQSSLKVKVGQKVDRGEILALVGNSGASGMPHLHFTMADMSSFSVRGRFSFQSKKYTKWINIDRDDLIENTYVRNRNPSSMTHD